MKWNKQPGNFTNYQFKSSFLQSGEMENKIKIEGVLYYK